jgi:predicted DNA-binding transcriptional regulator AlpA
MKKILKTKAIAERMNCSERTVYRLWSIGEGPPKLEITPRNVGSFEDDLEVWLESRRVPQAIEPLTP